MANGIRATENLHISAVQQIFSNRPKPDPYRLGLLKLRLIDILQNILVCCGIIPLACGFVVSHLTIVQKQRLDTGMPPVSILLLTSHAHSVALAAAPGALSTLVQVGGFLFVLLAASIIVLAMERLHRS